MAGFEEMNVWKLLIVEDETVLRGLLARHLQSMSIHVFEASNGVEALELLGRESVDAILSDINMPTMSGLDFLAELRKRGNDVPFVFLTARHDRHLVMEALRLGALDFLDKPFEPNDLEGVVLRALHWGVQRRGGNDSERLERLMRLWNHSQRKKLAG